MIGVFHKKIFLVVCFLFTVTAVTAQTQEDFNAKLGDIYKYAGDAKKVMSVAKEMYNMAEQKKELQNYSNYYLLKQVFENQAPDTKLATLCTEKADKLMRELVGKEIPVQKSGIDSIDRWFTVLFPNLFSTADPQNATKAIDFINIYTSYKTFSNYSFIAYAFERNGDFQKAKEYYELALTYTGNEREEYHSYSYYIGFLARSGEYLKAEEYIKKAEVLASTAIEMLKQAYQSDLLTGRIVYYLAVGDYQSYVQASELQYEQLSKSQGAKLPCDPYPSTRYTIAAFGKELLKEYAPAGSLWESRDSAHTAWLACMKQQYPNLKMYPLSYWPVYQIKRGRKNELKQSLSFYEKEAVTYYSSFQQYADIGINFLKASHLGFLSSPHYPAAFKKVMEEIKTTKNFRESTEPFAQYAYFSMRDRNFTESKNTYQELFSLNSDWINDVIFTFGEKAFVTYYNAKLKAGYENFYSFVKLAVEKNTNLFPQLAEQACNNILFTKSISLKGTQKRKEAFLNANDQSISLLYNDWIEKKQQLIRQYFKSAEPPLGLDSANKPDKDQLKKMQDEVNHLENELTNKAKDFKKYLKIIPPDWRTVREQLKENEAAVEIIRFQWRDQVYYSDTVFYAAYIFTASSQYPQIIYLPAQDMENKYYKTYKNSIRLKAEDKESYTHYWKPLKDQLKGIKKVFFSPDGIYHLINISTLKNPENGSFLLDEITVQYTTATTDINNKPGAALAKEAVLIGRPSFKTGDNLSKPPADKATRSFVRSFRENNIADLPGTEEEILSIKKELETNNAHVMYYLKEQATEDKLYTLKSPDILHIATHGYWSPAGENATDGYRLFNAMANSGLLLSGVVNYYSSPVYPDTYDGILTAYEAQNLNLENTSLVVLSACETSLGYLDAGEGVYGLQRAFRAAGARSIITSLWKVDDVATKDFMIVFYQELLRTRDRSAAFITAQKAIKNKYIHPYYWGGFIMTGE